MDGFSSAIMHSLEFFVDNTNSQSREAPLLEAHMSLSAPLIICRPSLDREARDGLHPLMEDLLGDIFKMSAQVERVASHLHLENYQV